MGREANLFRHTMREGANDLRHWTKEHVRTTAVALVAALLGIPAYLFLAGGSMIALQEQILQVAAYSLIGPALLVLVAYIYFCLRAPSKLYAKRIEELRDLRIRAGQAIDDLEEPNPTPWAPLKWLRRYGSLVTIFLLVGLATFFVHVILVLGQAYRVESLTNKAYQFEVPIAFILLQAVTNAGVNVCDQNHIRSADCDGLHKFSKTYHKDMKPVLSQLLPKECLKKAPALPQNFR